MPRTPQRWAAVLASCGILAPFAYTGATIAASCRVAGFDHLKNFSSELGATGAPGADLMNFIGFLPYGLLILAFSGTDNLALARDGMAYRRD